MKRTNTIDQATRRAQAQIHAVRMRAQKELERATKKADRAVSRDKGSQQQYSLVLGALAGTALLGGVAAWIMNRKRS